MADFLVNIVDILDRQFGVRGFRVQAQGPAQSPSFGSIEVVPLDEVAAYSAIGTPIYDVVRFIGGVIPGTDERYDTLELLEYPLVSVTPRRIIKEFELTNAPDTKKHFIGNAGYSITIQGVLVNHSSEKRPIDQLVRLNEIVRLPCAIDVESTLLTALGIDRLVIASAEYPSSSFHNVIPYSLTCLSDLSVEAQLVSNL